SEHKLLEELAEFWAAKLASEAPQRGRFRLVKQSFADRDLSFIKLLAQKLSRHNGVVALLGTTSGQAAIVLSRAQDVDIDVSALVKEALTSVGGRGGGTKDLAQGGVPDAAQVPALLEQLVTKLA